MGIKCSKCDFENPDDTLFCGKCGTQFPSPEEAEVTETLETPKEELTRGTTLANRYEIIEELGKGGMGRVYRVEDTKLKQEIALKLIKPEIAKDKKTIERFRNELKLARNIRHKNVCGMFDLGEAEGAHFITMEYVRGEDLRSLIRRIGQLPIGKSTSIAKQICEGLSEAHRLGVVHRDLKSNNIMIDKDGDARIMDFGIARSLEAKGITGAGVMIGTPEYMSPEQVEGKEVDQRSDIYSFGVILYEMVTGRVPFEGDTPFTIGMKHKGEIPQDPKKLNTQISDDLNRVILKCLEKDKEKRYQSVGEVRSELTRIEEGIPTTEREIPVRKPITSKEITVKLSLKKLLVPALAVLVLAAIALVLFKDRGLSVSPKRVVVASFENQTGDNSYDIIGRMTADWITQGLAQTGFLTVAPVSPEEIIAGALQREDSIHKLAKNSGAGTVVSGSYYLQGNIVYFQAKISNEQEDLLSAIEPVSGPIEDPLKPIQLLSQRIMGALASIIDPRLEIFVDIKSKPPTYESYQEYIEGLTFFLKRKYRQAIEHLQKAAALDSTFVLPLLWASVAHWNLYEDAKAVAIAKEIEKHRESLSPANRHFLDLIHAWSQGNTGAAYREAREMARLAPGEVWNYQWGYEAIQYNHPQEAIGALTLLNPEGIWMKDWYGYWGRLTWAHHMLGNHKQELKIARRGRKQFPEFLSTLWFETRALAALGRIKEVNKLINESLALPPQPDWNPGEIMLYAAQELRAHGYREASFQVLERAIKWFESRSQEELETENQRYILARVLYTAERWDEAKDVFDLLHKEFPDNVDYLAYQGMLAARRDDRDEAQKISSQLENIKRPYLYGDHTYGRACIAALLGEKENAISLLREAIAQGVTYSGLHPDMNLEPLSDYPAFKELIKPKG